MPTPEQKRSSGDFGETTMKIATHFFTMIRSWAVVPAASAAALGSAIAMAAPSPSGGQLLQQTPPPPTRPAQPAPAIVVKLPESREAAPGESFLVERIEVTGSTLVPPGVLRAIVDPSEGKMLTLADLGKLAEELTAVYQKSGYPFSRAYVPPQTLEHGRIRIAVLEARYDSVNLRNNSRVRDAVPNVVLNQLTVGKPVSQAGLDRALLLVSDIPGTVVKGTLRPGDGVGTSALIVDVDPGASLYGSASIDDYGNVSTGRPRANAGVSFNDPLRLGDVLSLSALTSGRGLNYGRVGYSLPVDGPATQVTAEASSLAYRVVYGHAVDLDSHGTANVAGAGLKQVLYRSTTANLYGEMTFDQTELRDHIGASQTRTDRHTDDWHGTLLGGVDDATGVTNFNLMVTFGHLHFDDATAQAFDAAGPRTQGKFTKFVAGITRLQRLSEKTSMYAAFAYQGADGNLDSSEQFFAGGPSSVRAYDNGLVSGTQGDSVTVELRRDVTVGLPGVWQSAVFIDTAHLQIARTLYAPGPNEARLSGAGVGLSWASITGWSVTSSVATPIGATPDIAGHRDSVRAWIQIQKTF